MFCFFLFHFIFGHDLFLGTTAGRPEVEYFRLDENTGRITLTRDIPEDQLNQPVTLVLKVGHSEYYAKIFVFWLSNAYPHPTIPHPIEL